MKKRFALGISSMLAAGASGVQLRRDRNGT